MLTVEFVQFGLLLMFWTAFLRFIAAKLANTSFGAAIAYVTP